MTTITNHKPAIQHESASCAARNRFTQYRATVNYSCSLESAVLHLEKLTGGRKDWLMIVGLTEANYLEKTSYLGTFESGRAVPALAQELARDVVSQYFEPRANRFEEQVAA